MKFLIVSLGSIGTRHARNIKKLFPSAQIIALRSSKRAVKPHPLCDHVVHTLSSALAHKPNAAIIANPTALHIPIAKKLAEAGIPLLIEKPLSHDMNGIDELKRICKKKNVPVLVGYCLRFHPGISQIKKLIDTKKIGKVLSARLHFGANLTGWGKGSPYQKGYSAKKNLGGGVMLDVIHEFDIAQWVLGPAKSVVGMNRSVSKLDIETEDVAETIIEFKSGCLANIHVDYLDLFPTREYHFIGSTGTIRWDITRNVVRLFTKKTGWTTVYSGKKSDYDFMYEEELRHFVNIVSKKEKSKIPIAEATRSLTLVLAAKESSRSKKQVRL